MSGDVRASHHPGGVGDLPQREARCEHREEAVGVEEQRGAARERDEAEGEELVEPDRLLVTRAEVDHELSEECTERRADEDAEVVVLISLFTVGRGALGT